MAAKRDYITKDARQLINIAVPFAVAGYVFYKGYASKGKTDWKNSGMMALIVFACVYIVATQVTRNLVTQQTLDAA